MPAASPMGAVSLFYAGNVSRPRLEAWLPPRPFPSSSSVMDGASLLDVETVARVGLMDCRTEHRTSIVDMIVRSRTAPVSRIADALPAYDDSHYVTVIPSSESGSDDGLVWALPGHGSDRLYIDKKSGGLRASCGTLRRVYSDTEGNLMTYPHCCYRLSCPVCMGRAIERIVQRMVPKFKAERDLRGIEGRDGRLYHVQLSLCRRRWAEILTRGGYAHVKAEAIGLLKTLYPDGGGVMVCHPWRQRDEGNSGGEALSLDGSPLWDWGVHFHAVCIGRPDTTVLSKLSGGDWKVKIIAPPGKPDAKASERVRSLRDLPDLLFYIMSHAGLPIPSDGAEPRDTYVYWGTTNARSKRGLRHVGDVVEIVYPVIEGSDGIRRFVFDVPLDLMHALDHPYLPGDYIAATARRVTAVWTHLPRSEWEAAGLLDERTLDQWRERRDVAMSVIRDADGPTLADWMRETGATGPPAIGDIWMRPEDDSLLSDMDVALELWRAPGCGLTARECIRLVRGDDSSPSSHVGVPRSAGGGAARGRPGGGWPPDGRAEREPVKPYQRTTRNNRK